MHMRLRRLFLHSALHVLGDCDYCGHSVIYHFPIFGCGKCSCSEFG
jgi:hypothetical protein